MNIPELQQAATHKVDRKLMSENADLRFRLTETEMKLEQMKGAFRALYEIAFNDASPVRER